MKYIAIDTISSFIIHGSFVLLCITHEWKKFFLFLNPVLCLILHISMRLRYLIMSSYGFVVNILNTLRRIPQSYMKNNENFD